jgi:hypothetical protein
MFGKYNGFVSKARVSATELYYITGGPARHKSVPKTLWCVPYIIIMINGNYHCPNRDPKLSTMYFTPQV